MWHLPLKREKLQIQRVFALLGRSVFVSKPQLSWDFGHNQGFDNNKIRRECRLMWKVERKMFFLQPNTGFSCVLLCGTGEVRAGSRIIQLREWFELKGSLKLL